MTTHPDERGRRAPTPVALASLGTVSDGYRILPDPLHGQRLLRLPARPAEVRVLLDRSHESAQAAEPTQDYLAVRCDPRRLSFAVTDGVGSSFLGDVAAQILAAHLTDWLAPPRAADRFDAALTAFLQGLSRKVVDQVAAWPLADSVAGLVRAALDQQRAYGSEAMFAGGVVDLTGGRDATVTVTWLGDARIRVILRDGRQIDHSGQTNDRWSSRLGPRGSVHSRVWPVSEVARVIACTDGLLPELDATVTLPDVELGERLQALARRPGNDDIALVDVGLSPGALPPAGSTGGPTLWRRLTEEPPGRHARTTPAGSALRRLMRAVGPAAVPVPEPAAVPVPEPDAPLPSTAPFPPTAPPFHAAPHSHAASPSSAVPPSHATAHSHAGPHSHAAPPLPGPPPLPGAPLSSGGPPSSAPGQSTVEHPVPVGIEPPGGVDWRRAERGQEVSWSPVSGADSYAVQVCREPTFAEPLLYAVRGLTFALPPMPGPVFVRLRCVVNGEPGRWGGVHDLSGPRPDVSSPRHELSGPRPEVSGPRPPNQGGAP
jgi:serine/threonine protein phosphatase PrpC